MSTAMTDYVSSIRFALNFEDHKNSVQVQAGDVVSFDGTQARYVRKDGSEITGKAPSLRSAINMKWLIHKTNGKSTPEQVQQVQATINKDGDRVPGASGEKYDSLRGGNFDEMIAKERAADRVPMSNKVLTEKDLTVKETKPAYEKKTLTAGEKLEVAGDQVEVRDNVMVNSSTAVPPTKTHKTAIRRSEDYGADSSTPVKFKGVKKEEASKQNAFTGDSMTPQVPEEATMAEVRRAVVRNDGESQDAQVVTTIKRGSMKVETVEGINLKEKASQKISETKTEEGITFKTEKTGQARTAGVKVSSGGETITDIRPGMDGVTVVTKRTGVNIPPQDNEKTDYLSMLPEDWGMLHWTKKEKFIKVLTDKGFLEFIKSVESIQAVQDACTARLKEID